MPEEKKYNSNGVSTLLALNWYTYMNLSFQPKKVTREKSLIVSSEIEIF